MDLKIDDLKISEYTKNILHELGFTEVSDLEGHDYISLTQKFPFKRHYIASIIQELNAAGYLLPPENAVTIYDVPMSQRLLHILERNYIFYLSQLSLCSKEELTRPRQHRHLKRKDSIRFSVLLVFSNFYIYTGCRKGTSSRPPHPRKDLFKSS